MTEETQTRPPREIKDPVAKAWYKLGFLFALNYVYAKLPANQSFDKQGLRDYVNQTLSDPDSGDLIYDRYFKDHPFSNDTDDGGYPDGQCPGTEPNTCIQCISTRMPGFPKES